MMGVGTIAREDFNMTATPTTAPLTSIQPTTGTLRRWTVAEYHQMIDAAILTEDDRVELIDGEIVYTPSQSPAHSSSTQRSDEYLKRQFGPQADVRVQLPITLPTSEPEPDLAIVRADERDYADHHPYPADIFLVMEVSCTTLAFNLNVKSLMYAKAGISECWVLDVGNRSLHILREPNDSGYQSQQILCESDCISLLAFSNIEITVADLLPPA
jgi:Uma2 family endonuclease